MDLANDESASEWVLWSWEDVDFPPTPSTGLAVGDSFQPLSNAERQRRSREKKKKEQAELARAAQANERAAKKAQEEKERAERARDKAVQKARKGLAEDAGARGPPPYDWHNKRLPSTSMESAAPLIEALSIANGGAIACRNAKSGG
jgi:predicted ribosome quality control (RQC) complex YloA/Tae2 family protein